MNFEEVAMEETRMKTHTSACCICRSKDRYNPGQVLRIYIPVTKSGIEELENMMFSEMEKENTCSLAKQFGGRGGNNPKTKECPNWVSHREMKKESHSCGRVAGHRDSQEESSEEGENTQ